MQKRQVTYIALQIVFEIFPEEKIEITNTKVYNKHWNKTPVTLPEARLSVGILTANVPNRLSAI